MAFEQDGEGTVRASISFPDGQYAALRAIARQKRVSVAWVVRDGVEQYFAAQAALFHRQAEPGPEREL